MLPSASHMDRSSMPTSFWLAPPLKNDHSTRLEPIFLLLFSIYLFIFPTFFTAARWLWMTERRESQVDLDKGFMAICSGLIVSELRFIDCRMEFRSDD